MGHAKYISAKLFIVLKMSGSLCYLEVGSQRSWEGLCVLSPSSQPHLAHHLSPSWTELSPTPTPVVAPRPTPGFLTPSHSPTPTGEEGGLVPGPPVSPAFTFLQVPLCPVFPQTMGRMCSLTPCAVGCPFFPLDHAHHVVGVTRMRPQHL